MKTLFDESKFKTKKDLFNFLIENKEMLIAQKRAEMKKADGVAYLGLGSGIKKAQGGADLQVKAIINTTNIMDSHKDVHLPGIWKKSLQENKMIMHLQEHLMKYDKIISDGDDLKAYTETFTWKELGYKFEGTTEALIFESIVKTERNPYMAKQYKAGYVKNHSVGMMYVKLILAINDEDYGAEFEAWEKYYSEVANKDAADESGYFWVVKEAKVIEGSAVPLGSNYATPTLEVKEPDESTQKEPPEGTHINFNKELINVKLF